MHFLPVFLDLKAGTVALVGAGPAALNKLRLLQSAGANVRWFSNNADVAEEALLANARPRQLEISFADPLQVDISQFIAVVAATGGSLDEDIAAHARAAQYSGQCRGPAGSFVLHLPRHHRSRRSRRCRRDRRRVARARATPARAHRGARCRRASEILPN